MNRRTSATALLAVLVLLAVALITPAASGAVKKLPVTNPVVQPPSATADDAGTPIADNGGAPTPIPGPVEPVLPVLHDAMRHLWMDHIVWSRMVTMSIFSELKGQSSYEQRLITNTGDMQKLVAPYFGEENAAYFASLYLQHVTLASQVFEAYKSGNETAIRAVTYDWYLNGEEIARYLCKINPAWNETEMWPLWKSHLDTVLDQMFDYKEGDFDGDVVCYDAAQDHAFVLADYLSDHMSTKGPSRK